MERVDFKIVMIQRTGTIAIDNTNHENFSCIKVYERPAFSNIKAVRKIIYEQTIYIAIHTRDKRIVIAALFQENHYYNIIIIIKIINVMLLFFKNRQLYKKR